MQVLTETERKTLEHKAQIFLDSMEMTKTEKALPALVNLLEPIHSEMNGKVERSELKEILLEIRSLREDTNKRFEDMQRYMDKRFEAMDRRFEDMQLHTNRHFEAMDKRFEDMQLHTNRYFEAMDKRLEDMQRYMDKRFAAIQWTIGIAFLAISVVMPISTSLILKLLL